MTAAIRSQFARCRPWIEAALQFDGEDTAEAVLDDLLSGHAQLWPGDHCAIVTQCIRGPEGGTIHAWLAGGILSELLALRTGIEAWGRSMGCCFATIQGRKGWDRLYRPLGYEPVDGVLRKRL